MHNTMGRNCEKCNESFIGDAKIGTPFDCVLKESFYSRNKGSI